MYTASTPLACLRRERRGSKQGRGGRQQGGYAEEGEEADGEQTDFADGVREEFNKGKQHRGSKQRSLKHTNSGHRHERPSTADQMEVSDPTDPTKELLEVSAGACFGRMVVLVRVSYTRLRTGVGVICSVAFL